MSTEICRCGEYETCNVCLSRSTPVKEHPRHPCFNCGALIFSLPGGQMFYDDATCAPHTCPKKADPVTEARPGNSGQYDPTANHEPIKIIEAYDLGFSLGNVIKYVLRAGKKPGVDALEDLRKAEWYIRREIERRGGGQ